MNLKNIGWSKLFFILSVSWIGFGLFLYVFGVREQIFNLSKDEIRQDQGCSYVVMLPMKPSGYPLMVYEGDGLENKQASSLRLLENGQEFSQPHILHDVIRAKGKGYSHWYEGMFFATSDCSNPLENGRLYQVKIKSRVHPVVEALFLASFLYLVFYLKRSPKFLRITRCFLALHKSLRVKAGAIDLAVFSLAIVFSTLYGLYGNWLSARSLVFSTAVGFPLSDAHGYWNCANLFLDFNSFSGDAWCYRRAIYPEFLSGLIWPFSGQIQYVLVIQALLTDLSIVLLFLRTRYLLGSLGAWVVGLMVLVYAMHESIPYTTTENAGLIFGVLGFAALLAVFQYQSLPLLALGLSFISLGLSARAGVLFALPALLVWVYFYAKTLVKPYWKWSFVAAVALTAGFLVQKCLIVFTDGPSGASFGSLAYTLYGLAVGGKGWAQVLTDYPSLIGLDDREMSRLIYQYFWEKFNFNPQLFFQALWNNTSVFWANGVYGYSILHRFGPLAKVLWWLSWIGLWVYRREPLSWLLGLTSVATLLAMPIIIGDGGARVFAATIAADVVQIGFGLTVLVRWLSDFSSVQKPFVPASRVDSVSDCGWFYPEYGAASLLVLVALSPFVVSRVVDIPSSDAVAQSSSCPLGQYSVRTRLGHYGTLVLDLVAQDQHADVMQGQVHQADFRLGVPADTWWWDAEIGQEVRSAVYYYAKAAGEAAYFKAAYLAEAYALLYSDFSLSGYYGKVVDLCVDPTATKNILSGERRKITSIQIVDEVQN